MEVIADILTEAVSGATKTRIMYRVGLNFLRFERYFSELLDKNLIAEVENSESYRMYITTEKGEQLLKILKNAEQLICV